MVNVPTVQTGNHCVWTHLDGHKDEVDADAGQGGVAEDVAGVDDARDEEHRRGQSEAAKQNRLKQSVAVIG